VQVLRDVKMSSVVVHDVLTLVDEVLFSEGKVSSMVMEMS
jgi:hypothetical protein